MAKDLKKIYDGSFESRQRFDEGGGAYASYAQDSSNYNPDQFAPMGSGAPSAGDVSALTSGATSGANSIGAAVGNPTAGFSTSGDPGQGSSGLSGALGALSGAKGSAVLTALTAILGAAGHMQTSKANATLPSMPGMGALPSLPGGSSTGGYGPSGGYNYANYKGLTPGSPGTGYAPRTQAPAAPLSSYYTYGQGPEQQFFQQVKPQGGAIAPVTTQKRGGHINKFAMGGMVPQGPMAHSGAMPRPVMPAGPGARPMAPRPAMGAAPMMAPKMNAMMPGSRPGMRPFAAGGQSEGALSAPEQGSRYVQGPGDGTSDDIPARLANGEYVLSADVVSGLGNGDNSSGAKVLDGFVHSLRTHKAENAAKGKLPADAKPIHHYMRGGK